MIIVGGGPAGAATSLFLVRRCPELAQQILILDKAVHPRFKVCAGGLLPHSLRCLEELDIPLEVPHVKVPRATAYTPVGSVERSEDVFCIVVRRDAFDALLLDHCARRGVAVHQGEKVVDVVERADCVEVVTERQTYLASIVVGADGSGSLVRRRVFRGENGTVARAVMADIPAHDSALDKDGEASGGAWCAFDFRPVSRGLPGYVWIFPCWIAGTLHWNVGVYSSCAKASGSRMSELLVRAASELGSQRVRKYAHPIRLFHWRAKLATRRVLLVGDAAGVDPLMGEGISYAFEYGRLAAESIAAAWQRGDDCVASYDEEVKNSWMGRKLRRLKRLEQMFYGRAAGLWFRLAVASKLLREVGLSWYTGRDGWDELTLFQTLQRLARHARNTMGQGRKP